MGLRLLLLTVLCTSVYVTPVWAEKDKIPPGAVPIVREGARDASGNCVFSGAVTTDTEAYVYFDQENCTTTIYDKSGRAADVTPSEQIEPRPGPTVTPKLGGKYPSRGTTQDAVH